MSHQDWEPVIINKKLTNNNTIGCATKDDRIKTIKRSR